MAINRVFWGIVSAAAAGAIIGLLFAPEEGGKMRKKLRKKTNSLANELIEVLEKSKKDAEDMKRKGEKWTENDIESVEDAGESFSEGK